MKRSNGEGTLYEDKKRGRWRAELILPNGKRKCLYAKTKTEVRQKLAYLRREVEAGLHGTTNGEQTLHQFAEGWLEHHQHRLRSKTYIGYLSLLRNHLDGIGDLALTKLTPLAVQQQYTKRLAIRSATTVQHIHMFLHVVLKSAVRLGIIPRNPTDFVDAPGLRPTEIVPLSETQLRHLFAAVHGDYYEAAYVVASLTGMREGELLGLRWEDIDVVRGLVRVQMTLHRVQGAYVLEETKSRSSRRTIPLTPYAIQVLNEYRLQQKATRALLGTAWGETWNLVFTTEAGRPVNHGPLLRRFRRILMRNGLPPHTRLHDLRHTFATLLLEQGVHIKVVSDLLGHSSIEITLRIYGHVTPRMQDKAVEALAWLSPALPIVEQAIPVQIPVQAGGKPTNEEGRV